MNHEDNERHYKAWLDKNSWRRDLQRLEQEYGAAPRRTPGLAAGADGGGNIPQRPIGPPFTDEFHFDAMSVIRYLGEALKNRPYAVCDTLGCGATVRPFNSGDLHFCTVCAELAS